MLVVFSYFLLAYKFFLDMDLNPLDQFLNILARRIRYSYQRYIHRNPANISKHWCPKNPPGQAFKQFYGVTI